MELTIAQRHFFEGLDMAQLTKRAQGEGRWKFSHKGRLVEVKTYADAEADILLHQYQPELGRCETDWDMSLVDIPGTEGMSALEVLQTLPTHNPGGSTAALYDAWRNTSDVSRWEVEPHGEYVKFLTVDGETQYLLYAFKGVEGVTVEVMAAGEFIGYLEAPVAFPPQKTPKGLLRLADAITLAWEKALELDAKVHLL